MLKEKVDDGIDIRLFAKQVSAMSDQEFEEFKKQQIESYVATQHQKEPDELKPDNA